MWKKPPCILKSFEKTTIKELDLECVDCSTDVIHVPCNILGYHLLRSSGLWPFSFVAISVCVHFGLWPLQFVAISVCNRFDLRPFRFVFFSVCGLYDLLP